MTQRRDPASPIASPTTNPASLPFPAVWDRSPTSERRKALLARLLVPAAADLYHALDWEREAAALSDPHLRYPAYFTVPHHGVAEGYLSPWQAIGWGFVERIFRVNRALPPLLELIASPRPRAIVELGSGVARLGLTLAQRHPGAQLTLVDLSPFQLVAARRQAQRAAVAARVTLRHAAAESTGLPTASADLVLASLLFHELPQPTARAVVAEAARLLAPGGRLIIFDAIQSAIPWPAADRAVNRALGALLHEVYWMDYQTQPVWPLCAAAGFAHVERRLLTVAPWIYQVIIATR